MTGRLKALAEAWDANAANWTRAVREGRIASRTAGADAAVVDAIVGQQPRRLLDAGCGEGWLVRRSPARPAARGDQMHGGGYRRRGGAGRGGAGGDPAGGYGCWATKTSPPAATTCRRAST